VHRVAALLLLALVSTLCPARLAAQSSNGISANPGAVNIVTGTGSLGRLLGFDKDSIYCRWPSHTSLGTPGTPRQGIGVPRRSPLWFVPMAARRPPRP